MALTEKIIDLLHRAKRSLLPNIELSKWPVIGGPFTAWRNRLLAKPIKIGNFSFFTDPQDSLALLANRDYSPDEQALYSKIIQPGSRCVELGANIGFFSVLFGSLAGEGGRVYAFEPSPVNAAILRKNLALNEIRNVEVLEKAVSDTAGTIKLFLSDSNYGDNRIYASEDSNRNSVEVETVALDQFFSSDGTQIDFLKMDIQGAEYKALTGMKGLLKERRISSILLEFWPYGLTRCGDSPEALLDLLVNEGFFLYELTSTGSLKPASAPELIQRLPPDSEAFANLFAAIKQQPAVL